MKATRVRSVAIVQESVDSELFCLHSLKNLTFSPLEERQNCTLKERMKLLN